MGEHVDVDLLLVTAPQELARARESAAQERRQIAARKERGRRLAGNPAARKDLAHRWAAVTSKSAIRDAMANAVVYEGDGPPATPPPPGVPVGAWYMDTLTGTLYRLEA